MVIKEDKYGTYGEFYKCPVCGAEFGGVCRHITEQLPILCPRCLDDDSVDMNLKIKTLIYYVRILQENSNTMNNLTSCLRIIR